MKLLVTYFSHRNYMSGIQYMRTTNTPTIKQICQEYSSEQQILKWHEGNCISTECDIHPRHMCCYFCYQLAHSQSAIPFFLKVAELANSPHYLSLTTVRIVLILQLYICNFLSLRQSVWHH
jgi:hypothetical protein